LRGMGPLEVPNGDFESGCFFKVPIWHPKESGTRPTPQVPPLCLYGAGLGDAFGNSSPIVMSGVKDEWGFGDVAAD
jgi:hypothetical protein